MMGLINPSQRRQSKLGITQQQQLVIENFAVVIQTNELFITAKRCVYVINKPKPSKVTRTPTD